MPSAFDSLCGAGKPLKAEPPDAKEFAGLKRSGLARLKDAGTPALSLEGRFDLAYNAAHALCFAALRWHGYRSNNRYIVFQLLSHTLGWGPRCGACCPSAMTCATSANTRATSTSTSASSPTWSLLAALSLPSSLRWRPLPMRETTR